MFSRTSRPSYSQGFARGAWESKNPGLWKGLLCALAPSLGVTGQTLFDQSPYKNHGTLVDMEAADWELGSDGPILSFDGAASNPDRVTIPATSRYKILGDLSWVQKIVFGDTANSQLLVTIEAGSSESENDNSIFFIDKLGSSGAWLIRYIHEYSTGTNETVTFAQTFDSISEYTIGILKDSKNKNIHLYVDGKFSETYSYTNEATCTASSLPIEIAARGDGSFSGEIKSGNFYFYNRVLTASEMAQFGRNISAPFQLADAPIVFTVPAVGGIVTPYYYTNLLAGGM